MGISQRVLRRFFNTWTGIGTSVPGPRPSDITTTSVVPGRDTARRGDFSGSIRGSTAIRPLVTFARQKRPPALCLAR